MAAPTSEELVAIEAFKGKVGDILRKEQLEDDEFLIRWLRARDMNLEKAEAMLRNSMKWRADNQIDTTLDKPVDPYFSSTYPFSLTGKDKDGRPLIVLPIGRWDARKAVEEGKTEQLLGYINFFFESVMKVLRESENHKQFTAIVDWDGYSFSQFTNIKAAQTVLKMSAIYEAHYPEILWHCVFINTTAVFKLLWALMRKILAEKTVGKIQVFGTNRSEWEPVIMELVDTSQFSYELKEGEDVTEDELKIMKESPDFCTISMEGLAVL